jgi:glyoxylase-like metal-dependent hydrolase (beta-lactamase superfamily II)
MNTSLVRAFVSLISAGLLYACSPPAPPTLPANTEQVADGVYLFQSGGHRSLFLIGSEGVIVTDPLNADAAREYHDTIAAITDKPVKYVVYSHYHWDRVSGAEVFTANGAEVVAQERCAERFVDNPNPAVVMPDTTFGDQYEVSVGGASLGLHYFGPAHGDCLTVFVAKPARLIQVVDLVEPPRASFPYDRNVPYIKPHNIREFFASVEALVKDAGITQVLASHVRDIDDGNGGTRPSPPVAPVSIIADQGRFWNAILDAVLKARNEGNIGIDSFVRIKTVDVSVFEPYDGYRKEDLPIIMRRFVGYYDMGR